MQKHEIISLAADYIAQARNQFSWYDGCACTVGILARIAMGNGHEDGKMLSYREFYSRRESILKRMKSSGDWDGDEDNEPKWSEIIAYENKASNYKSYPVICLNEHGFTDQEICRAESASHPDYANFPGTMSAWIKKTFGFASKNRAPVDRKHVVSFLRSWAKLEREAHTLANSFHVADRPKPIVIF